MRWCDQHRDEFTDDEFVKVDDVWYHERGGRHPVDEPWPAAVNLGDWPGPSAPEDDR